MTDLHAMSGQCANCGAKVQGKSHSAEKVISCPRCNAAVVLRSAPSDPKTSGETIPGRIHIACTHCAKRFSAASKAAGTRIRCPKCAKLINVPLELDDMPPMHELGDNPPLDSDPSSRRHLEDVQPPRKMGWVMAPNAGVLVLFVIVVVLISLLIIASLLTAMGIFTKYEIIVNFPPFRGDAGRITYGDSSFLDVSRGDLPRGYLTTNWWPLVISAFFALPIYMAWSIVQQCRRAYRADVIAWALAVATGFTLILTVATPVIALSLTHMNTVRSLKFTEYERLHGHFDLGMPYAVRAESPLFFGNLLIQSTVIILLGTLAWHWFRRLQAGFQKQLHRDGLRRQSVTVHAPAGTRDGGIPPVLAT